MYYVFLKETIYFVLLRMILYLYAEINKDNNSRSTNVFDYRTCFLLLKNKLF